MVLDKVKEEWISTMCKDHPKLPRFMVEDLAGTYALDDGEWLKENKKKGERLAKKQAKKGKENSPRPSRTQTVSRFQGRSRWSTLLKRK